MQHIDIYSDEAASFEADVNLLIRNTLHAALAHLSSTAEAELADIKQALDKSTGYEFQEHLVDAHVDVTRGHNCPQFRGEQIPSKFFDYLRSMPLPACGRLWSSNFGLIPQGDVHEWVRPRRSSKATSLRDSSVPCGVLFLAAT